jgi:hypothetical protein
MDVLAGRKTAGRVTGDVRVCGLPKEATRFSHLIGYVSVAVRTCRAALLALRV